MKTTRRTARILMLIALMATPGLALGAADGCLWANVPDPVLLPDGHVYPAGTLALCAQQAMSPSVTLHVVRIGGMPVGFARSHVGRAESPAADRPYFLFARTGEGWLRLIGMVASDAGRTRAYVMSSAEERSFGVATTENRGIVMIAASGR